MNTDITAETLPSIAHNQTSVITTELLAQLYGTDIDNIKKNYSRNADRFTEGKHFFKVTGSELRKFKHKVTDCPFVKIAGNVRHLMLWTERGAARHAKMLETDQAWEVFEKLEDNYFNQHKNQLPKNYLDNIRARFLLRMEDQQISEIKSVPFDSYVVNPENAGSAFAAMVGDLPLKALIDISRACSYRLGVVAEGQL
ncbi:ORF6N domain-containing protein [Enterobacter ludwigii]|uniref:ORF6N domain-containing protein n=1 Tax=Enterobacter ludwigii TaxID=299767 RepID=UPI0009BB28D9|nr:ORF6N domain-containing protein [Enterobacter ludwigii]